MRRRGRGRRIAFLGTGTMGSPMALRLIRAGHRVTVYNRTPAKARPLVKAGAESAPTPAQAVEGAQFIIAMVGDDGASRSVWEGAGGALSGRPDPEAIAVESSTLSLPRILELERKVKRAGLRFIDCPVTGGPDGARRGGLTLLVGADPRTLARAREVLSSYSRRIIRFGPPGAGTAYKLIVNLVGAAQAAALAEGLVLAERAGLDLRKAAGAMRSGAIASPLVKNLARRMAAGGHEEIYFAARWRRKDASYGLKLGRALGVGTPVCRAAEKIFRKAISAGWGDRNESVIIDGMRKHRW